MDSILQIIECKYEYESKCEYIKFKVMALPFLEDAHSVDQKFYQ